VSQLPPALVGDRSAESAIMFEKPFRVRDWVIVGDAEGIVENVGFRSTRIRTFHNSLISIPNSDLINATVDNMGMRQYRRVRTILKIRYDTAPERIEGFLEGIKQIIRANEHAQEDYLHVVLHEFGEHSLDILLYFFLKVHDWSAELVERQRVILEILRLAEAMEIEFAFPTQTLHMESLTKNNPAPSAATFDADSLRKLAQEFGPEGARARPKGSGIFKPPSEDQNVPGKPTWKGDKAI